MRDTALLQNLDLQADRTQVAAAPPETFRFTLEDGSGTLLAEDGTYLQQELAP